ncbi:uncharacterized protein LOC119278984 isoform X2 [Triticum dicoccoides]|uniref:uncharacterized protein LOC119278984 isoform X2 n=1 Tax=Triticum dicoccoides TaxID=85692 RepID=UPI000E7D050C|nr:uncharacterized protein LOC119278984 isoform X2 [Triticum dicoccoides]
MGKKRKQDQWRDDSSSSNVKRRRSCHCENGETSRPNDGISPREGLSAIVRAVTELKDVMQLQLRMEEKFNKRIQKLKEKRKKDKKKHEEDLRVLKEELESKFEDMQKEVCGEVNHYKASPSQRSQLSQSTRFRLVIENSVSRTIYKKETIETVDGGGHIKVVMYDGGNPIASDHRLASVRVELVVIEGGFDEKRDSWSKEEFEERIIKPRRTTTLTSLVKNGAFNLIGGSCDHEGAIIMDNSQQREVKLGVRITVPTETRVLEGVSNPFKVQEGKTKKSAPNKTGKKLSHPVPTRNLVQPTSTHAAQHDRGKHSGFPTDGTAEDNRLSYPPATVPPIVEGNGHALNCNSQQSSQQIPTPILWQPTSTHSMQHGYYPPLPAFGQDQFTSLPNASSQVAFPNLSEYGSLDGQWNSIPRGEIFVEDVNHSNVQLPVEEYYIDASFTCGQVLLQWYKPQVELKEHWNFLDQLMPLYSTQSGFYRESFHSTSLMEKAHKLMGSTSGDSVMKIITSLPSRATQTPQRRGVLVQPIAPYDSHDEPPVKKQRNAKYQLRFVNRVCNEYYTWEQIKSEDGNLLKVALYDENNLVVTSGPLSAASVEIVLLHGDFSADGQDYWPSEEFRACLVHPQSVKEPPALGGDGVLALTDGEADISNMYFRTSSFHARTGMFKMGLEIKNAREESVQEGITRPFLVRVCQGEESSCPLIRPFKLFGMGTEDVGASSALHYQSLQVRSVFWALMAEHHHSTVRRASNHSSEHYLLKYVRGIVKLKCLLMRRRDRKKLYMQKSKDADDYNAAIAKKLKYSYMQKNKDADDSASAFAKAPSSLSVRAPRV